MPLFGVGGVTVVALLTWGFLAFLDVLPGQDMTQAKRGVLVLWAVAVVLLSGVIL